MPWVYLKDDPSQRKKVAGRDVQAAIAEGWVLAPNQDVFLQDAGGETLSIDAASAQHLLSPEAVRPGETGFEAATNISRRAQRKQDLEEHVEGFSNRVLATGEAFARGLSLGTSDLIFGDKATRLRREENGLVTTGFEIAGSLAPVLLSGGLGAGAAAGRAGAKGLASRLIANTPAGLAMRAEEAARLAVGSRMTGLAGSGALGRAAAKIAPYGAQGVSGGLIYGAGEGVSQLGLSDKPITAEAIFSEVGGNALHGAAIGGGVLGGMAAGGAMLKGIQKSIVKRLDNALDSQARRDVAEYLGQLGDEEMQAALRTMEATPDREMLDLLEKQGKAKIAQEQAERKAMGLSRAEQKAAKKEAKQAVKTLEDAIEAERKKVAQKEAGDIAALEADFESGRSRLQKQFSSKRLADNPEVKRVGELFAKELKDVHRTTGFANRLIENSSANMLAGRREPWAAVRKRFKDVFTKDGKLVQDAAELARILGGKEGAANRKLLAEIEDEAVKAIEVQYGKNVDFDDLLANYKITDEFINASKLGLKDDAAAKLHEEMFTKHLSGLEAQKRARLDEIMASGRAQMEELAARNAKEIDGIQARFRQRIAEGDEAFARSIDSAELDKITQKIDEIKGDLPKKFEKQLHEQFKEVNKMAAEEGFDLSMVDKIALVNELGLDMDIIPEGSLIDKALTLHGVMKIGSAGQRGIPNLISALAGKTPVGQRAVKAMFGAAESALGKQFGKAAGKKGVRKTMVESVMEMGSRGARTAARELKNKEVQLYTKIDKSIDKFMRAGVKAAPYVTTSSVKILNNLSFLPEESGPKKVPKNASLVEVFNAKAEELSQAIQNPDSVAQKVEERLGALPYQEPLLSGRLTELALRRMQFFWDKMPKNPGMGAFGQKLPWRPADSEIAKWARYIDGADNPGKAIEDMGRGRMSMEQAEAVATIYPELYQEIQVRLFDKLSGKPEGTTYPQRLQLSILMRNPVDSSMKWDFVAAMQQNFLPKEPPPPASQVNPGRLSPQIAQNEETPAQRTLA